MGPLGSKNLTHSNPQLQAYVHSEGVFCHGKTLLQAGSLST